MREICEITIDATTGSSRYTEYEVELLISTFPEFKRMHPSVEMYICKLDYTNPKLHEIITFMKSQLNREAVFGNQRCTNHKEQYKVKCSRVWEDQDYEKCNYFTFSIYEIIVKLTDNVRDSDNRLLFTNMDLDKKVSIGSFAHAGSIGCDEETKLKFESLSFPNLDFELVSKDNLKKRIWKMCSVIPFPPMKEEAYVDDLGREYVEGESRYRKPKDDMFYPHLYIFDQSEVIDQLGDFDVAELTDLYYSRSALPRLACSRRFRNWCLESGYDNFDFSPLISRSERENYLTTEF